ncbi:hypothetical protein J2Z66_004230 [Paenibacillus eucommiae]|uniref:Uncharacterized protein n=1 Tax=Paenibacillus eucommiae TaxID=1355755 RepID=A0ABS4J0I4_9BACL|nr:DUF5693 family protein [Paenibacillus eucommiae]MBP1992621.1 hypothetical protein [Paenibacillus eucommiae]
MIQRYTSWNKLLRKALWWLVIIGMLCSLPLVYTRYETETSAKQVEFVFDYRDLLDIADLQTSPQDFVKKQLVAMKEAGIGSLAVYEATLSELRQSRLIEMYNSREAVALTQTIGLPNENFTYILFSDAQARLQLQPLIEKTFADLQVRTRPWSFKNQAGLIIEMIMDEASLKPMDPDPITLSMLKEQGFQIVVRLSNRRAFVPNQMDALLKHLYSFGVKKIIVDGDSVPGYTEEDTSENLDKMAELLHKYGMGLAAIEMLKQPQKGFNTLAKETNFDVVRLHSYMERDGEKLMENLKKEELEQRIQAAADRLVLAVKDRNIRMVFLNAKPLKSLDRAAIVNPLNALYASLNGKDGAIPRIEKAGFTTGQAEAFLVKESSWQKVARFFILVGSVSLITLLISYFFPQVALLVFVIGLVGAVGLHTLSGSLYAQGLALGAAISAPSIAVMLAIRSVIQGKAARWRSGIAFALLQIIKTSAISMIGVVYVIVLLNQITYFLVLEQFRGVGLLHLLPIAIVAIYLLLFSDDSTYTQKLQKLKAILSSNIRVLWLVLVGIAVAAGYYYLSRTGNEGQAPAFEKLFRSFLENTLGVRPRIKEFLFAHPLFFLGAYLSIRYKHAVYLMLIGVIGQLSIVDTFAHLHTPMAISGIRISYGIIFGIIVGLVMIAVWEIVVRSWKRWAPQFKG